MGAAAAHQQAPAHGCVGEDDHGRDQKKGLTEVSPEGCVNQQYEEPQMWGDRPTESSRSAPRQGTIARLFSRLHGTQPHVSYAFERRVGACSRGHTRHPHDFWEGVKGDRSSYLLAQVKPSHLLREQPGVHLGGCQDAAANAPAL
jgi:hypothetical protein